MVFELVSGLGPQWLGADPVLTALGGLACAAAAWVAWRERRASNAIAD